MSPITRSGFERAIKSRNSVISHNKLLVYHSNIDRRISLLFFHSLFQQAN